MAHSENSRHEISGGARPTHSRRLVIGLAGAAVGALGVGRLPVVGQESTPESTPSIQSTGKGDMPTTGASRPGPVGQEPPATESNATRPASIIVESAGIDAEIEALSIVDGRLEDPTGPWVVSWYEQSADLGEIGNLLFAGHVDYWGVGPSVFYNVGDLGEGEVVQVTGESGEVFSYAVVWNETIGIDELISGRMSEIAAPTENQSITMFTCGGEFDYVNGEYLSRTVVRAERIRPELESTPEA